MREARKEMIRDAEKAPVKLSPVKVLRLAAGLSQEDLCMIVDLRPQQLSCYESGSQIPDALVAKSWAEAIGVETDVLIEAIQTTRAYR